MTPILSWAAIIGVGVICFVVAALITKIEFSDWNRK